MGNSVMVTAKIHAAEEYTVSEEPYYLPIADEVSLFETAYAQRIPVLLKGPTGCGKTRFVEYMAHRLGRPVTDRKSTRLNSSHPRLSRMPSSA